jgi:predicted adenylyl cyclase CyaB
MEEIEIKFVVKDTKAVTEKLRKLGFRIEVGRHREKNYLFDDASGNLQKAGKLLRVRKTPSSQTTTYKGPILATSKLKHREEIECRVENAETMIRIFEEVGFKVRTEYSKYRTVFQKDGFHISLDETEAGNYLEVEGPSDAEIIQLGAELGYSEKDFVRRTYAELIGDKRGAPIHKSNTQEES